MTTPYVVDGVLYGADEVVGAWVQKHLHGGVISGPYTALGVLANDGKLVCGAMWYNQRDADVELGLYASDFRPSMPAVYRRMLAHPYQTLGVNRVSAEIAASNERVCRLALGLGFRLEGRKRQACKDGGDTLLFGMLRDECIFLKKAKIDGQSAVTSSTN